MNPNAVAACRSILSLCRMHASRLAFAMNAMRERFPLTGDTLRGLSDLELAVLDQFTSRFAKLQDALGAKLFPAALELAAEPGDLAAFLDKLHRLERIGAIESADRWLLLREMRNAFAHDYPDEPDMQAATLNKAFALAGELLATLDRIEAFIARHARG